MAGLLALLSGAGPASAAASQPVGMTCTQESFPVTEGVATTMTGLLCSRGNPAGKTLIYTLPGATYSNIYWNFPVDPAVNNFTVAATLAGYAVLDLNELGTLPRASYPPAADVTVATNADALHQVINDTSKSYPRALLFGHSFGSIISATENSTYHDPSILGVDLQGFLHSIYTPGVTQVQDSVVPAQTDPVLEKYDLPDGYLTTAPGTRQANFGSSGDEAAAVIQEDEATKTTTTGGELAGQVAGLDPSITLGIRVPVDVVVGQYDTLFCGPSQCPNTQTVYGGEKSDYRAGLLSVFVLPRSGHSVNLAENAPVATVQQLAWAYAVLHK